LSWQRIHLSDRFSCEQIPLTLSALPNNTFFLIWAHWGLYYVHIFIFPDPLLEPACPSSNCPCCLKHSVSA
jgi:hypothetical protein